MNDTFDRLAYAQGSQAVCAEDRARPTLGLVVAGGMCLGMWFGLAQAVRWAACSMF